MFNNDLPIQPVSRNFGFDRGNPIDRYYIESFLKENSALIKGAVLEVGEPTYTKQFGGSQVTESRVLHKKNTNVDITGDLGTGANIPANRFDCFIMTQTLLCIYDVRQAVKNAFKLLKPGGYLLITVPGISQISRWDMEEWGQYWCFTDLSLRRLLEEAFPPENLKVRAFGNVKVATCFLYGFAQHEISQSELDYHDPDFQLNICAVAQKPLL